MRVGDKYIIEIEEVQTYIKDDKPFELGRVKGFRALTLDEYALKQLEPYNERDCPKCQNEWIEKVGEARAAGYELGFTDGKVQGGKEAVFEVKRKKPELKVGDEVKLIDFLRNDGATTVETWVVIEMVDENNIRVMDHRGKTFCTPTNTAVPTGGNFPIKKFFKALENEWHDPSDDPFGACTTCTRNLPGMAKAFPCYACDHIAGTGISYYEPLKAK